MKHFLCLIYAIITTCLCLYANSSDKIYVREGHGSYGSVKYTVIDQKVREGYGSYGSVIYTIDGKYIRKGNGSYGDVLYTIDGTFIAW